ncbi:MAG: serine hydrolase [Candidatus Poribacteria bacterium]|nr:serine hydrolase [Candidatus Poribacteria bacterium]
MSTAYAKLQAGSASDVGISQETLEHAAAILESEVQNGRISAASILVARDRTIVLSKGYGHLLPDKDSPAVEPDSVFLLASITKPVTACALMLLVDRGQVSLNDPVSQYVPEFQGGERDKVRVRDLLSHTSGMPDMLPQNTDLRRAHAPLSEFVRGATQTPLLYSPGTNFRYQSKGILLAAEIVERVSGKRLRDFERQEIFEPLGMENSALGLGRFQISETVWCGLSTSESEDQRRFGPNSRYWRNTGCPWGGMHSTAPDLAILLQTMLNGGGYGDRRVFSVAGVKAMTTNQNKTLAAPWGLGWGLADSKVWNFFGELVSPATFGHTGATGTVAWADPERQLICVILTNQMVEGGSLLRRVSNAVSASIVS